MLVNADLDVKTDFSLVYLLWQAAFAKFICCDKRIILFIILIVLKTSFILLMKVNSLWTSARDKWVYYQTSKLISIPPTLWAPLLHRTDSKGEWYTRPRAMIFCQMTTQSTWGRLAAICRCKESRSFSASWSLISVSPNLSWVSRKLSINLSRSSNIDTISCSKLASSPENCELRWLMLSSEIVGITSHIIFHMSATRERASSTLLDLHYTLGQTPIFDLHYYYLEFTKRCDRFMSLLFSGVLENISRYFSNIITQ